MEKQTAAQPAAAKGQGAFEWYEALISAALVLVLVFSFFFRIIQVDGASMVPTLQNGDKLIVWGAGYEPQRGDVVIVDSYTAYGKPLVKRVIAKGGDTIAFGDFAIQATERGKCSSAQLEAARDAGIQLIRVWSGKSRPEGSSRPDTRRCISRRSARRSSARQRKPLSLPSWSAKQRTMPLPRRRA